MSFQNNDKRMEYSVYSSSDSPTGQIASNLSKSQNKRKRKRKKDDDYVRKACMKLMLSGLKATMIFNNQKVIRYKMKQQDDLQSQLYNLEIKIFKSKDNTSLMPFLEERRNYLQNRVDKLEEDIQEIEQQIADLEKM